MLDVEPVLGSLVCNLSNENYEQSLVNYHFWFELGQTYAQIPPSLVFNSIWDHKSKLPNPPPDYHIYPTAPLVLRFVRDAESSHILDSHSTGLLSRLRESILQEFFDAGIKLSNNLFDSHKDYIVDANLIAHCANLGYIEEAVIRDQILQSLISQPCLYNCLATALIVLFKIAGATFVAYVDPAVIDRCFCLLRGLRWSGGEIDEVIKLRQSGWEGLPPPPVFPTRKPKLNETPIAHSPSISVSTLSDFTMIDTSDDQSPVDPAAITPHDTFFLQDGNVEVLCGNTLFRLHTSILSLHSSILRQGLSQAILATAESPNGCPRILSSDSAMDFTTFLKVIYLPGFPQRGNVPDFNTFSSLLRIATKYEMPAVRSGLLEAIKDAYPETYQGVTSTKRLGEEVFGEPTPHPNTVLNLFVQQKLTSALPMAYYMAVRRGVDLLMDRRLPPSATLPPDVLQSAIKGFIALRELELSETHRLVLNQKPPHSSVDCPLYEAIDPGLSDAHQRAIDQITGFSWPGTRALEVLSLSVRRGPGMFCKSCVRELEVGHIEVRKRAWDMLPKAFVLSG